MRRILVKKINKNKNRIVLINYADENYKGSQHLQTKTAKIVGFTDIMEYGPEDIEETFRNAHLNIFNYKRGNGLWIWKPYIILETMELFKVDDVFLL